MTEARSLLQPGLTSVSIRLAALENLKTGRLDADRGRTVKFKFRVRPPAHGVETTPAGSKISNKKSSMIRNAILVAYILIFSVHAVLIKSVYIKDREASTESLKCYVPSILIAVSEMLKAALSMVFFLCEQALTKGNNGQSNVKSFSESFMRRDYRLFQSKKHQLQLFPIIRAVAD